jgi:RNA polymerase sigma-70 factor (ECF subfamily)
MKTISGVEVYEKHANELVRFATGLVGPNDAADVVADAMIGVLWSDGWSTIENPRAYLYRAVLNQSRSHHRGTLRRRVREMRAAVADEPLSHRSDSGVWEAVAGLAMPERAAVFLHYWEGMTTGEIADELTVSDRSVRRHLARARRNLRGVLND